MLSQNAVVKVRKALEKGYTGTFTVTEHRKITRPNHTVGYEDVVVLVNQPCRLSFSSSPATADGDVPAIAQTVKLFFAPDITVKEGSKITVTQNDVTTEYRQSGTVANYSTHKEVILELFKGWA